MNIHKKSQQPKPDKVTQSIDYVFKMLQDGRMDDEEANILMELIFSGQMKDEDLDLIRFMYRVRPKDFDDIDDEVNVVPITDSRGISITIELGLE